MRLILAYSFFCFPKSTYEFEVNIISIGGKFIRIHYGTVDTMIFMIILSRQIVILLHTYLRIELTAFLRASSKSVEVNADATLTI